MKIFSIATFRKWLLGLLILCGGLMLSLVTFFQYGDIDSMCGNVDFYDSCPQFWYQVVEGGFSDGLFLKALSFVLVMLLLLPHRSTKWWSWFAVIAIPYVVWDILTTETQSSGLFAGLGDSPRLTSLFDGLLFVLFSVAIALSSALLEKMEGHVFRNVYYRIGAYAACVCASVLAGILSVIVLFMVDTQ